jgi:hypothetical protein
MNSLPEIDNIYSNSTIELELIIHMGYNNADDNCLLMGLDMAK